MRLEFLALSPGRLWVDDVHLERVAGPEGGG
jgi:hypothetical protein